jgi:pyruvate,orthophosphate dikinase
MQTYTQFYGSATTRNPLSGEDQLCGELFSGPDRSQVNISNISDLQRYSVSLYEKLITTLKSLEKFHKAILEVNFTIRGENIEITDIKNAKRSSRAVVRFAVEMAEMGIISKAEAVLIVKPSDIENLLHPQFAIEAQVLARKENRLVATGLNGAPGAVSGHLVFSSSSFPCSDQMGDTKYILVVNELKSEHIDILRMCHGLITIRGGATSHAAVIARQIGIPCVLGVDTLKIDDQNRIISINELQYPEYAVLSIDGGTGELFQGIMQIIRSHIDNEIHLIKLLQWADSFRTLKIRGNCDNASDAALARKYGAEGIGVCRTEHMFLEAESLSLIQNILFSAPDGDTEKENLETLSNLQRRDLRAIFEVMTGYPVTIRLLDLPLHEFLPDYEKIHEKYLTARYENIPESEIVEIYRLLETVREMREINPMLGFRGVRLGILRPAIYKMQVEAIFNAACDLFQQGGSIYPEIMVPLCNSASEVKYMKDLIAQSAAKVIESRQLEISYSVGTMIELPRAALISRDLAQYVQFFSFGTNDLTQTVYGLSRDDAEVKFLLHYLELGLLPNNPFQVLDEEGVGRLIRLSISEGRDTYPELKIGICGEHGGDPQSITFCHNTDMDYVSCSSHRIPVARLSAAHANLQA